MQNENEIRNQDGLVLRERPVSHYAAKSMPPAPRSGIFMSPNENGPDNCPDIQSRNGQMFQLVAEVWDEDLDDAPLTALIRFPDGLEIEALEEEIGWGECVVGGKPWPPE